jgi:hypothetical protein
VSELTRRLLGVIEVDSGTLVVGDPGQILPNSEAGRSGIDFAAVIDAPFAEVATPLAGTSVLLLQDFGGDGSFPVIGEFIGSDLARIVIELDSPADDGSDV